MARPSGAKRRRVRPRARVDNPFNGASPLINAASGRSAEGGYDNDSAGTSVALATIGNLVWHDFHPNDMQDGDEPGIPDVPITVYGPGPDSTLGTADDVYVSSTFTDANGAYSFPNLGPGTYRVEVTAVDLAGNADPTPAATELTDTGCRAMSVSVRTCLAVPLPGATPSSGGCRDWRSRWTTTMGTGHGGHAASAA